MESENTVKHAALAVLRTFPSPTIIHLQTPLQKIMDLDINSHSMHSPALLRLYHSRQTLGMKGLQRGCCKALLMLLLLNGLPGCSGIELWSCAFIPKVCADDLHFGA